MTSAPRGSIRAQARTRVKGVLKPRQLAVDVLAVEVRPCFRDSLEVLEGVRQVLPEIGDGCWRIPAARCS